jgi:hypothetical protein
VNVFALLAWPSAFANPLEPLIKAINSEVDAKRAMETVNRVYATDRWFTFPKFEETALGPHR